MYTVVLAFIELVAAGKKKVWPTRRPEQSVSDRRVDVGGIASIYVLFPFFFFIKMAEAIARDEAAQ